MFLQTVQHVICPIRIRSFIRVISSRGQCRAVHKDGKTSRAADGEGSVQQKFMGLFIAPISRPALVAHSLAVPGLSRTGHPAVANISNAAVITNKYLLRPLLRVAATSIFSVCM